MIEKNFSFNNSIFRNLLKIKGIGKYKANLLCKRLGYPTNHIYNHYFILQRTHNVNKSEIF